MRMPLVRSRWKRMLGFVGVLALAAIFYTNYLHAVVGPLLERHHARRALASATPTELEGVVGPLGRVFRFADNSWIAIRYTDSHASLGWSLCAARDSTGKWFESKEHFCGSFVMIQDLDEIDRHLGDAPPMPADPPANRVEWIRLLAASPDLKTARERLTSAYFHEIQ